MFEAEGYDKNILQFKLPVKQSFILIEEGDDLQEIIGNPFYIEYIEKLKEGKIQYYRIAKGFEGEFQLIYILESINNRKIKLWLEKQLRF